MRKKLSTDITDNPRRPQRALNFSLSPLENRMKVADFTMLYRILASILNIIPEISLLEYWQDS